MEDKIEISNQYYHVTTKESPTGQLSSKIFLDSPEGKTIIGEIPITILKKENTEITMQTFHKKILSSFLRLVHTYRDQHNPDKIKSLVEEKLLPKEESIQLKEHKVKELPRNNEIDQWNSLCNQHLPNNILAAYKQKEQSLLRYNKSEYNTIDDEDFIFSIQEYLRREKKNIVGLISNIDMLTFTTKSQHYFIFYLDEDITIFIVAPLGSLGIYMKHIELFKDTLLST